MADYTQLTEEQLLEALDKAWLQYMYFQAAEGNWEQEREARERANAKLAAIEAEVRNRGIK